MVQLSTAPSRVLSLPPQFLLPSLESLSIRPLQKVALQSRSIRSVTRPDGKASRFNYQHDPDKEPLMASPMAAWLRKVDSTPLRPGLLGYKRAMSAIYDPETGHRQAVTIIQVDRNQVVAHKTLDKHNYIAACMGCGSKSNSNVTRPMLGEYSAREIAPKRHLMEFRVADEKALPAVGTFIGADWFSVGQYVDAQAKCKGKGFAGGMKRHGFHGQDASHGASLSHRSMGSAGQSQGGGSRVYPGKRMPGRMGGQHVTMQNLKVVRVDKDNGLIVVAGAVPGPNKGLVKLIDARKKSWPEMPAAYLQAESTPAKDAAETAAA